MLSEKHNPLQARTNCISGSLDLSTLAFVLCLGILGAVCLPLYAGNMVNPAYFSLKTQCFEEIQTVRGNSWDGFPK